ncbi:MAG: raffinose/stachyose/melibiose transport system substrate-binding protein [Pseudonocardiales bacterium]|jgi:raffinose/stachyose/melibiose transport system substrate-binding protein|nr:raffinose/stachyose/melibiose transport system substrate-binding protein [Pseudonocardiales bacterium]MDT4904519.1 raffinose/stachyose/melibiose transport system substrate-binding protein [Pseudonocardiales bacterium]MDT4929798.1 raffinose/stachyose/melibiose transport system substrate-binding protein [Pseudonocardiales bacterium]MDT4949166.1 raffinose/stachyose/melibiose transport system substrate-binding protein [Pseudonocardiales bacterium]
MHDRRRGGPGGYRTHRTVGRTLVALGAAAGLFLTACSSSGSGGSSGTTLVVQNGAGGATGLLAAYAKLNKQFEAAHKGVKIKFVTKSFDEVVSTAKLQLSGSNPPDVTQTNQGYQAMGTFVKAGLLTNLDDYAKKYDWVSRQSSKLLELNGHFSANGVKMGDGPLWGISVTNAWIGLLMNMDVASQLGISAPPTTFAELEQDLSAAKQKGAVPFQFGSSNGEMPAWLLSELLLAKGGPEAVNDIVFHRNAPTFKSSAAAWAAQTLKTWSDKGYFTKNYTAYKTDEAFAKFAGGSGLFDLAGSWLMPLPGTPAQTKKFKMVVFPSVSGAGPNAVAAGDMPWTIPAHSKHHDLAAEYINFISSATSADALLASGNMPSFAPADLDVALGKANLPSPSQDAIKNGLSVIKSGSPVPFIDWGAPDLYDAIKSGFESLAAGSMSVDSFLSRLQDAFGPFVSSLK